MTEEPDVTWLCPAIVYLVELLNWLGNEWYQEFSDATNKFTGKTWRMSPGVG
jgi:hypothetical protein